MPNRYFVPNNQNRKAGKPSLPTTPLSLREPQPQATFATIIGNPSIAIASISARLSKSWKQLAFPPVSLACSVSPSKAPKSSPRTSVPSNPPPNEAHELKKEVQALCHVLETLVTLLRSEDSEIEEKRFDQQSILRSMIKNCEKHVLGVYKNVSKLKGVKARLTWPFRKEECIESVRTLHRYSQTLQVLLVASNRWVFIYHSCNAWCRWLKGFTFQLPSGEIIDRGYG
jgi:hypothetical protein